MSLLSTAENEVMTISQFCEEAEFFGMSKEYYDLVQESYELDLLSRHIACQDTIIESGVTDASGVGLITESTANVDVLTESFGEKAKNFFKGVWSGFIKAMKAVGTFFVRLAKSWVNGERVKQLEARVAELENLSKEEIEKSASRLKQIKALYKQMDGANRQNAKETAALKDQLWHAKVRGDQLQQEANVMRILWEKTKTKYDKLNAQYKGVDADLYKRLQMVSASIADEVHVLAPAIVEDIDALTKDVVAAMEAFDVAYGAENTANTRQWAKIEKQIRTTADRCRALKVRREEITISANDISSRANVINTSMSKAKELENTVIGMFYNTTGKVLGNKDDSNTPNPSQAKFGKDITNSAQRTRTKAVIAAGGITTTLPKLLQEYIELSSSCIQALTTFLNERTANISLQNEIISAIAAAKSA